MTLTTVYQVSERGSRAINKMARYCHQLFAVVAILFFATGTVSAEYIGNYSDWKSLSLTEQNSYIMGLRDSYMLALNESNVMSISFGLDKCEIDLRLSSGMLVEAVSNYYSADTENWSQAPSRAFFDEIISGVCLKYVNEYRAEYGLELWLSP